MNEDPLRSGASVLASLVGGVFTFIFAADAHSYVTPFLTEVAHREYGSADWVELLPLATWIVVPLTLFFFSKGVLTALLISFFMKFVRG